MRRFLLLFLASALSFFAAAAGRCSNDSPKPQRIVSINVCLDALLIKLVEPERINSLYYLSANPQFSAFANQAKQFYLNRGLAEDIVPRNPDLILAGEYTSPDLKSLLKSLGLRTEIVPLPRTLNEIPTHIRTIGALTGNQTSAEIMAQQLEQTLSQVDKTQKTLTPIPAFWYSANGVVMGRDTMENELMTRAGFYNLALDKHILGFKQIDLEELLLAKPQVLIVDASDVQAFSLAQEYLQHPVLRNRLRIIHLPSSLACIAPVAAEAIENLLQQRLLL